MQRRSRRSGLRFRLALLLPFAFGACDPAPIRSSDPSIEGSYRATAFSVETGDRVYDQLTGQTSIQLTLTGDQRVKGALVFGEVRTSLTGKWKNTDGMVHLDLGPETFLSRMPFTIEAGGLNGMLALEDGDLRLTLAR